MKKVHGYTGGAFALVVSMALGGAGCGNNPNEPKPTTVVFTAQLSSANEVPPVTTADASGSGTATITFHDITYRSSGEPDTAIVDFNVSLSGFAASTEVIGAHIHTGTAGTNGVVILDTGLTAAGSVTIPSGTGSFTRAGISADGDLLDALNTGASGFYFNVHTLLSPNGAVRGQIVKQ
jgi:hypothetical protein